MKTYKVKSSAVRAAKKELGKDAVELVDYNLVPNAGQWSWEKIEAKKTTHTPKNKSTIDNPCSVVWNIAEEMKGAKRKEVIHACVLAGVAFYTARTQYQQWRTASKQQEK